MLRLWPSVLAVSLAVPALAQGDPKKTDKPDHPKVGYTDTPQLPGSKWRVHDADRPQPPVVEPGTASTAQAPGKPPSDAVVLFDGKNLDAWTGSSGEAKWKVEDGAMTVNGTGDLQTKEEFGDCQLHIEWSTPAEVKGHSQERGNSGVFLMGRYEVQVLDSYDNVTYADGQAAAVYGQNPPMVNACRKPGEWQAYDIVFEAPRFDGDGRLTKVGRVTVLHNGVVVQHAQEILGDTAHRSLPKYHSHPPQGPLKLQDHGNPVRYRNIWVRRLPGGGA